MAHTYGTQPSQITHAPNLQLSLATLEDVEDITDIWYKSFHPDPFSEKIWPDTPSVRRWLNNHNREDMINKSSAKYMIVKDVSEQGAGKAVGYAKWSVPVGEERLDPSERFPPGIEGNDARVYDIFFSTLAAQRKRYIGESQYYYLDMLGTIPEYRRLGVANLLVDWGCRLADRDGLQCYVDASDAGIPVYEKFDFLAQEPFKVPGEGYTCTSYIRPVKK